MTRKVSRAAAWIFLTLMSLSLATCLSAEQQDYIKYDPAKDEFQFLTILRDIHGQDQADLDFLAGIYKNRDHLIMPSAPTIPFFDNNSVIRISDAQFYSLSIFASPPTTLEAKDTAVHLNSVTVTPGTFFLQDKMLCYFQAITVPGKTVDAALEELSKSPQTDDTAKIFQDEIDRRAGGGKVYTWADARKLTLDQIDAINAPPATTPATVPATSPATTPAASQPESLSDPLMVLEVQSLKNLKQAIAGKSLRITRQGRVLKLSLPLTATDSTAFTDLFTQSAARWSQMIQNNKDYTAQAALFRRAGSASAASGLTFATDDKGLVLSLDLLAYTQFAAALPARRIDNNSTNDATASAPATKPAGPDPVRFIRGQKIPLNETLTVEQIVKDFNAGTLKAYPSEKPVKPGEGIGSDKTATPAQIP